MLFPGGGGAPTLSHAGERRLTDLVEVSRQSRRPVSDFIRRVELINLEGSASQLELEIPLNRRLELLGGEIEMHYAHSMGLDSERSRLRVFWDDEEVGARPLGGSFREGRLLGRLPSSPIPVERYRLRVSVEQRLDDSGSGSITGAAPWTQLDPSRSWVALNYRKKALQPVLSEMRGLIDDTLWDDYCLGVVTAPVYATGERHLEWGGQVAQRAALWMGNRSLRIRHDDEISDRGDEIVIGCRDELIGILPPGICDQISHSFVGIYSHPENRENFLLVLSGLDEASVDRAVRSFVFSPDRLPDLPRIDVTRWEIPPPIR